jgi:hypothetical protein
MVISPHARRGFVDHTLYDTTSILRFIERRHGLKPLSDRDAKANNLLVAFDFDQHDSADVRKVLLLAAIVGLAGIGVALILLWRRARRG